ncbi:cell division protein SepF [Longibaculum muris]|uniref:cell division protein SepF n=1 Tax=Longibaculum muris TaxID=1796628 RepID=UPI00189FF537|nr:cell division protein SepF [Longibaculum muris]
MDKLKKWLLDNEEFDEDEKYLVTVKKYEINDYNILEKVGEDIKQNDIVICNIEEKYLVRTLDFIDGISFVLDVEHVILTKNIHLFVPKNICYKSIS